MSHGKGTLHNFKLQITIIAFCLSLSGLFLVPSGSASSATVIPARIGPADAHTNTKKSPTWAMISSALLPGGGQFYTENYKKGLLFALAQGTLSGMTLYEHIQTGEAERALVDHIKVYGDSLPPAEIPRRISLQGQYDHHFDRRRTLLFIDVGVWILAVADAYISAHFYKFDELSFSPFPNPTVSAMIRF